MWARSSIRAATRSRRARHVPTASRRSSNCSGSRRSPATRTGRFRQVCCCSARPRIRVVPAFRCRPGAPAYTESLTTIKSFYRLADGVRTVFLANSEGRLLDLIDIERWGNQACREPDPAGSLCEGVSAARQSHAPARPYLCRPESVARDQGICRRRRAVHVSRGQLASARSAGEVPALGGSRRRRCARDADLSDRARTWQIPVRVPCSSWRVTPRQPSRSWCAPADRLDSPQAHVPRAVQRSVAT